MIGILFADAKSGDGIPVAIKCQWFRVRGDRPYPIPKITSNVYQLSAEDVGCSIQVQAHPLDQDEAEGIAFGQFGPIELDPQAKQTLEQVLGTGGSQFPVSINLKKNEDGTDAVKSGEEDLYEEED